MKKIINTVVFAVINIAILAVIFGIVFNSKVSAVPPKSTPVHSEYENDVLFEAAMKDTKPFVIYFYTNWCGYCRNFAPKFDTVSKEYADKYNFIKVDADNPENANITGNFYIPAYPTVYLVDPVNNKKLLISNRYTESVESFTDCLDHYKK